MVVLAAAVAAGNQTWVSCRTRPLLSTLEEMERESASLPAAVPETEGLTALIQKADEWKAKAAVLAAQKAPLKKMREVLHMGLRMPVEVPQVEALRAEIRRREWEDTAKKVSSVPESTRRVQGLVYGMHRACGTVRFAHGLHALVSSPPTYAQSAVPLPFTLYWCAMHADLPLQSWCRSAYTPCCVACSCKFI